MRALEIYYSVLDLLLLRTAIQYQQHSHQYINMSERKISVSFKFPFWLRDKLREGVERGRGSQAHQLETAFEAHYGTGDTITDTDRINWLADPKNTIGNVQLPRNVVIGNVASLRGAIDEAMEMDNT